MRDSWRDFLTKKLLAAGSALFGAPNRDDVLGDRVEMALAEPVYQSVVITLFKTRVRRSLFPPSAIRCGGPTPEDKRQRIERNFRLLYRVFKLYLWANALCAGANAHLLPDVAYLQFFYAAWPGFLMLGTIAMHKSGMGRLHRDVAPESIAPDRWLKRLKRLQSLLISGEFSPSQFAVRSALEALVFVTLFLGPVYAVIRGISGDGVPDDLSPAALVVRFAAGLLLLSIWFVIRKSNRIMAEVIQQEIDALEDVGLRPVSV